MPSRTLPPPRLDRPTAMQRFRTLLEDETFTAEAVCDRLELESIFSFRTLRSGRSHGGTTSPTDGLDHLIRLFMDGEPTPPTSLEGCFGGDAVEAMVELGLLAPHPTHPEALAAGALVYPVDTLQVASDLNEDAPGGSPDGGRLAPDAVYPAIADAVQGFLADLPRTPCRRLLDLCAGTGVAALLSAPVAEEVWAVDITERATHFARFNALLNGIDSLTARAGDLYDPLAGEVRRFDRIVAHPPYLPTLDPDLVFRDGGSDGEEVFRRIVEGLPDHLAAGGLFYGHGMATDREDAPLETRLREMLGSRHEAFDVYLAVSRTLTPEEFVLSRLRSGRATPDQGARHLAILEELQVERFVRGSILIEHGIEHRGSARRPITVRRRRGRAGGWPDLAELRGRERLVAEARRNRRLSELRPRLTPGVGVRTTHRVTGRGLAGESVELATDTPFRATVRLPLEAGPLLPLFDGTRTVDEVRQGGIRNGLLPPDMPVEDFHGVVSSLLLGGFLHLEASDDPD